MKKLIILVLFCAGCGGGVPKYQIEYDKTTITVKNKSIQVLSQADWHNQFRQQAVVIDTDGNEYRYKINEDLTQYNRLLNGKKYIVSSYRGYLNKVEEAP